MKKLISFSLLLVIILSLASCVGTGGITEDDCVGTWVSDEVGEYDDFYNETQYWTTTIKLFEYGSGTYEETYSKDCLAGKKGETLNLHPIKWRLENDVLFIEYGDSVFNLVFSEKDDTKSTLKDETYFDGADYAEFFYKQNK